MAENRTDHSAKVPKENLLAQSAGPGHKLIGEPATAIADAATGPLSLWRCADRPTSPRTPPTATTEVRRSRCPSCGC
jgi:hypothetical protein